MKPRLDAANIKLLLVSIGTPERGKDFARETGFPQENLLADPENACYDTLGFYKGAQRTFFHPATPFSMRDRIMNGSTKDLQEVSPSFYFRPLVVGVLTRFNRSKNIFFIPSSSPPPFSPCPPPKKLKILSRWKPWIPPKLDQGLQQGGLLCFDGTQSVFSHKDQATGAHADFDDAVASLMDDRDT